MFYNWKMTSITKSDSASPSLSWAWHSSAPACPPLYHLHHLNMSPGILVCILIFLQLCIYCLIHPTDVHTSSPRQLGTEMLGKLGWARSVSCAPGNLDRKMVCGVKLLFLPDEEEYHGGWPHSCNEHSSDLPPHASRSQAGKLSSEYLPSLGFSLLGNSQTSRFCEHLACCPEKN